MFSQGPSPQASSYAFAGRLGSWIYSEPWVGKDSRIPSRDGYPMAAIDAPKELGIPVLRWSGGRFAGNQS